MRIAQLAPVIESVPPAKYGGIELVVSHITDELVRRGHKVTLFASGDSSSTARLVSVVPQALRADESVKTHHWPCYEVQNIFALIDRQSEFDIVHSHVGWQMLPFAANLDIPCLTTMHCLVEPAHKEIYSRFAHLPYAAISNAFQKFNLPGVLNYVGVVHNGIDLETHYFDPEGSRDYLLFLGRICQDKGTAEAIEIANRLGLPLKIVGKIDPTDTEYYDKHIKAHLDNPDIEFLGELDLFGKVEALRHAIALLYPIRFEEPFGLVMAEALACGVPVLALNRGSVSEILSDGETAILANSVDELVQRFPEVHSISRHDCRARAKLFSKEKMASEYEALYEKLLFASTASGTVSASKVWPRKND